VKAWRLLPLEAFDASLAMAVEEALLQLHSQGKAPPTVRFYQWAPPAISLGRFQRLDGFDLEACRRHGFSVVRRSTGGRAVLHLGDLTYSVVAGTADGVPATLAASYRVLCEGLVEGLRLLEIEAGPSRETTSAAAPAVCFLRSAGGDLAHQGRKFLGSAQCRRGESLLQHGSVLLASQKEIWAGLLAAADPLTLRAGLATKTTSVEEILGRPLEAAAVAQALARGLEKALGVRLEPGTLTAEERALANELAPPAFPVLGASGTAPRAGSQRGSFE